MKTPRPWSNRKWGVAFIGAMRETPSLLGEGWYKYPNFGQRFDGETSRALMFKTRRQARAWCKAQHAKYEHRNDCCKQWRFRPVRVQELIQAVE